MCVCVCVCVCVCICLFVYIRPLSLQRERKAGSCPEGPVSGPVSFVQLQQDCILRKGILGKGPKNKESESCETVRGRKIKDSVWERHHEHTAQQTNEGKGNVAH